MLQKENDLFSKYRPKKKQMGVYKLINQKNH